MPVIHMIQTVLGRGGFFKNFDIQQVPTNCITIQFSKCFSPAHRFSPEQVDFYFSIRLPLLNGKPQMFDHAFNSEGIHF